ncbi:hypothetical protein CFP56_016081 [Quercus suber]|uniref:Phorbol-ester/DAG-type domain-containing protein n=1 Tax=Quercus suber TaxID=58331 RepID=A0AAW0KQM1_QUESU
MEKMINHFSHTHPLMLRSSFQPPAPSRGSLLSLLRPKPDKHCSACQQCYEGPAYCCDDCSYYLHESCAGLPFEIQHFYHSSHSLTLHGIEYTAVNCNMCQESWMGFTYRCKHCDFKMDIQCAKLQPVIRLSIHDHPLTLQVGDTEIKSNFFCDFCNNRCDSNWTFCCKDCNFKIDFDCARMLLNYSKQVQHFSHEHWLTLAIVYRNSDVYSPVCCFLCDKPCNGPTYVCFLCKFNLHEFCLESLQTVIQNPFHKHPLIKFEKKVDDSTSCSACGEPCLDTTFACLKCKYLFHELCIQLPQEIQHFFHPCPLILRQETTEFTCKGCEKSRTQFAFHCNICHFYLDVQCALMFTENFEGQKCIKNSSHRHPLILCNKERNGHVNCNGCLQVIFGEIYGCVQCNFYLHRSCAAAPQQIKHPFHPNHTLTLRYGENLWCMVSILKSLDERGKVKYLRHKHLSKSYHPETEVCCGVCEKSISGPSYNCISCKFFIHQDCLEPVEKVQHPFHPHEHVLTLPKPSINYKGHRHQFTFFKKVYDDPECEVCKFRYNDPPSYLRCAECDFNVHLLCAALPSTINHKCHIDPLDLEDYFADDDSSDDDSGEYYCDACEETRDKQECVYRCAECSNYVAHINCVLDEAVVFIVLKLKDETFLKI